MPSWSVMHAQTNRSSQNLTDMIQVAKGSTLKGLKTNIY